MEQEGAEGIWELGLYDKRKFDFFEKHTSFEEALDSL